MNRQQIVIREYKPGDKPSLTACLEELCDYLIPLDPIKRIRRLLAFGKAYTTSLLRKIARSNGALFVAEHDGRVVGIIAGVVMKINKLEQLHFNARAYGRILELYVNPEYRGRKVGKRLIEHMEAHFKEKRCDLIRIEVFEPNTNAYRFYQSLGYSPRIIDVIKEL